MTYHLIHSGWMVLGYMADHRPHNPLVLGSSPSCPTFFMLKYLLPLLLLAGCASQRWDEFCYENIQINLEEREAEYAPRTPALR